MQAGRKIYTDMKTANSRLEQILLPIGSLLDDIWDDSIRVDQHRNKIGID